MPNFPSVNEHYENNMSEAELIKKCRQLSNKELSDWLHFEADGPFCNSKPIRFRILECAMRLMDAAKNQIIVELLKRKTSVQKGNSVA